MSLAKSSYSRPFAKIQRWLRLDVLNVLSAARRLAFWQSRAAIGRCCKRGARKPASTGHSRGGCPEVLYLRGFQSICIGDALSTRGSEAPLGKASGNARQRFLCLSRIHLTFATALLRLAVLLVLFAACRLVSKINSLRYSGATLYKINTVVLPRKPLFQRARACSARQRTAAPPSPQQ